MYIYMSSSSSSSVLFFFFGCNVGDSVQELPQKLSGARRQAVFKETRRTSGLNEPDHLLNERTGLSQDLAPLLDGFGLVWIQSLPT